MQIKKISETFSPGFQKLSESNPFAPGIVAAQSFTGTLRRAYLESPEAFIDADSCRNRFGVLSPYLHYQHRGDSAERMVLKQAFKQANRIHSIVDVLERDQPLIRVTMCFFKKTQKETFLIVSADFRVDLHQLYDGAVLPN